MHPLQYEMPLDPLANTACKLCTTQSHREMHCVAVLGSTSCHFGGMNICQLCGTKYQSELLCATSVNHSATWKSFVQIFGVRSGTGIFFVQILWYEVLLGRTWCKSALRIFVVKWFYPKVRCANAVGQHGTDFF